MKPPRQLLSSARTVSISITVGYLLLPFTLFGQRRFDKDNRDGDVTHPGSSRQAIIGPSFSLPSCGGSAIPAPATIILPPSVPQPAAANDIVGINIQNTGPFPMYAEPLTFGQIFAQGQVQPSDSLVARINNIANQVQVDPLATWPDGSVKLAALTLQPTVCSNAQIPALLSKATSADPVFPHTPVSLAAHPVLLSVTLNFSSGAYSGTKVVDLGTPLAASSDLWLHGPLATQPRVDIPLTGGPLHITADVSVYSNGVISADVQFNNDLTTTVPSSGTVNPQAALPPLQYTATVWLQGIQAAQYTVSQGQYTDWHVVVRSNSPSTANIQHDVAYLERSGAILPYDRTTGVLNATVASYVGAYQNGYDPAYGSPGNPAFGTPLSANGVTMGMPTTGGRADIGYTTQFNTVWLLTQDARAASLAILQGDAGGAVPWNFKLANGHWLTPGDDADIWTDGRGGPHGYTDGILNLPDDTYWTPDTAHQPNLNYVPYIMTASRWNLDRLNAQAANALSNDWPGARCQPNNNSCATLSDIVVNGQDQIRSSAWSIREIQEAAFVGKPGTFEQTYFNQVVADNWNWIQTQIPSLTAAQGEAAGYIGLGSYGSTGVIPQWMEDYLTGTAALGGQMGFTGASQYVSWQKDNWLAGRFIASDMNPYDGCTYNTVVASNSVPFQTWSQIEAATIAAGDSNGPGNSLNWVNSNGDYCPLARAALGSALTLFPLDVKLRQALAWLNASGAPYTNQQSFQADPTFNVVPLQ